MKKNIFLSAFVLLIAFYTNAQSVQYGLNFGANLTNLNGNGIENSYDPGFIAGVFSRITLNKKWNFQPELLFNYANTKKADNFINFYNVDGYANADTKIKLSYISVPLLIGYKVNKLFTINAGPQYSLLVYDDENLLETSKAAAFKRNDIGIVAGAEIKLDNVSFFGRYVFGLANVNNIDDRYKWHNRQVQLGLKIIVF